MDRTARYEHWLVEFYNRVAEQKAGSIEEIPEEIRTFLGFLDYHTIIEPFLARDLLDGHSREIGPIRYGVTEGHARAIGAKYGAFPRKKTG